MHTEQVKVEANIDASADDVWSIVRDFCAPWHPLIASMSREITPSGRVERAFTVNGEDTLYRERLTWFSDSERRFAYTHVAGIEGAERYDGWMSVVSNGTGCRATMGADIQAHGARATDIAAGTKAIFDMGLAELARLSERPKPLPAEVLSAPDIAFETRTIGHAPRLAFSSAEHKTSDTLCLFLHGIGGNKHNWDAQLTALAPLCSAAALDLRGYGDSSLGQSQTTIGEYCKDILDVVDSLKPRRLILCGLSYGAWIATSFAMRHADRLAALVLAGGCTGMSEAPTATRDSFRQSREAPILAGQKTADFAPQVVSILAGPDCSDTTQDALRTSMAAIPTATYLDALTCFTNPPEMFDFSRLTMSVLMMTGEFDKLAPPAEIRGVAKRILAAAPDPDVRFECLNRAGHVCNLEAPDLFNAPLIELVQRVCK